jgi:UDP-glucose 4-epimerase
MALHEEHRDAARRNSGMTGRVLVTGGAGFIGSHVSERFLEEGWTVEILDDLSSGKRDNLPARATFHRGDIGSPDARKIVRDGRFDVICHLAAQIDVRRSVTDPAADARTNILGTLNLIDGMREAGRPARFVTSSTGGAIYGAFVEPPSGEDAAKEPEAPYGVSKLSVEYYLASQARIHGLDVVALRYSNVYGPRQDPHGEAGVVAIFCGRLLEGRALTVYGDGAQTRDYVYVGDVARANFAAATAALPPIGGVDARAFNIGTGRETSVLELGSVLGEVAGSRAEIQHAPARPGELARSAVRIDKAAKWLRWKPAVSLREGLSSTYEWFAGRHASATG